MPMLMEKIHRPIISSGGRRLPEAPRDLPRRKREGRDVGVPGTDQEVQQPLPFCDRTSASCRRIRYPMPRRSPDRGPEGGQIQPPRGQRRLRSGGTP